jgi:putative hydrolase of the HAD superfamily
MKEAVLFDLGNTLVHYYERPEFPPILREAVARVSSWLAGLKKLDPDDPGLRERVEAENYEADDHRVRPLEERLANIFRIDLKDRDLVIEACRRFMEPIFDRARIYDETLGVLAELGRRGYRTAIVSNTPWGSPALLWQEELLRLGLIGEVDEIFFCRDAGWRKPSPILFSYVIEQMMITPRGAIFVGDDHRRDCVGAAGIGIDSILVDRTGSSSIPGQHTIGTLTDLLTILR